MEEESRGLDGTNTGTYPFVPPLAYSAHANPYGCSQFPPAFVGLAARPRAPTSPAMLTLERLALPKLGEAGGAPYSHRPRAMTIGGWGHGVCRQSRRRRIV